jgi:hypothetical protein
MRRCQSAVEKIQSTLVEYETTTPISVTRQIRWAVQGKNAVQEMVGQLELHREALQLALDIRSLAVSNNTYQGVVKTGQILSDLLSKWNVHRG